MVALQVPVARRTHPQAVMAAAEVDMGVAAAAIGVVMAVAIVEATGVTAEVMAVTEAATAVVIEVVMAVAMEDVVAEVLPPAALVDAAGVAEAMMVAPNLTVRAWSNLITRSTSPAYPLTAMKTTLLNFSDPLA